MDRPVTALSAAPGPASPWAPLRSRAFRWLWVGVLVGYIGVWAQTVGAQWLLVENLDAGGVVALVQTAATLPVMLLALPAGVLADVFDRRWVLFAVQIYVFVTAGSLALLTVAGQMTAPLLLGFTFLLGLGGAVQLPAWQAVLPELVPRSQLGAATRLEMVGVNVGRSIGPALAGLVIALAGVPAVFALNAASVLLFAAVLLRWRRRPADPETRRERFVAALRAGGRYVWFEPVVRRILLRTVLLIGPGSVLWALLPLVAREQLGLGAGGYGLLFAALGVGAIGTVVVGGRLRARLSTNRLLAAAGTAYAAALLIIVLVPTVVAALPSLVLAGLAWTTAISTLNAELQLFLPVWVRARGLAVYLVVFTGALALGSLLWGTVTALAGVRTAFLIAAGVMLAGVAFGLVRRLPEPAGTEGRADYWTEPRLAFDPEADSGPIAVRIEYTIAPDDEADFLAAMERLRTSRRRTGATRWELYRDAEHPDTFVELFRVASWEEHLRQHNGRLTVADQRIEEVALGYSDPPARAAHLLPP